MAGSDNGTEKRTAPRYGCVGDAEIVVPGRGLHFKGHIGNLSAGGCFIETHCALERGTAVEVWMMAHGQPLRVAANLMVRRSSGVGLRFLGVTERKLAQIRYLIAELAEAERGANGELDGEDKNEVEPAAEKAPEVFSRQPSHHRHGEKPRGWLRRCVRKLMGRRKKA